MIFPSRDYWRLLEQLSHLSPQWGGSIFEAPPPNWTSVVKVCSKSLFIGQDRSPSSQLTLSDPLNIVPHEGGGGGVGHESSQILGRTQSAHPHRLLFHTLSCFLKPQKLLLLHSHLMTWFLFHRKCISSQRIDPQVPTTTSTTYLRLCLPLFTLQINCLFLAKADCLLVN